jgi:hypothetical protein
VGRRLELGRVVVEGLGDLAVRQAGREVVRVVVGQQVGVAVVGHHHGLRRACAWEQCLCFWAGDRDDVCRRH